MNEKLIRKAIDFFIPCRLPSIPESRHNVYLRCIIDLAEKWLDVNGLPEKKFDDITLADKHRCEGRNEAIDLCRLAVAKYYVKKEEIEEAEKEGIGNGF